MADQKATQAYQESHYEMITELRRELEVEEFHFTYLDERHPEIASFLFFVPREGSEVEPRGWLKAFLAAYGHVSGTMFFYHHRHADALMDTVSCAEPAGFVGFELEAGKFAPAKIQVHERTAFLLGGFTEKLLPAEVEVEARPIRHSVGIWIFPNQSARFNALTRFRAYLAAQSSGGL